MKMTKKKIAIITGASSGMGRECVIQLADRFAGLEEIWVIARRKERLFRLVSEVPVPLKILELDLQREEAFAALEEKLEWEEPEVKILVNAAGFGKIGQVSELSLDEETGMTDVNCRALAAVTRLVLPYMTKNSRILQFASAAAFLPQPGFAIYAATKADPKRVVKKALRDSMMGKPVSVYGPLMKAFWLLSKLCPHELILSLFVSIGNCVL